MPLNSLPSRDQGSICPGYPATFVATSTPGSWPEGTALTIDTTSYAPALSGAYATWTLTVAQVTALIGTRANGDSLDYVITTGTGDTRVRHSVGRIYIADEHAGTTSPQQLTTVLVGPPGKRGVSIDAVVLDGANLVVTLDDATVLPAVPLPSVQGLISAATGALTPEDVGADPAGTAAAAIAALGLGTAAQSDATDFAPAASGAYPVQQVTLTGNLAYTLPVDAPADQVIPVVFTQDGTGGHAVTYDGQPVSVDLTAGAVTTVELHPVGAGYVVRYPAAVAQGVGVGVARFIERARAGENLTITCLGDSILEGRTVTNPATDGAMILLAADLSVRFGVTVTQTNHARSGYTALRAHIGGNVAAALAENADLYIVSAFDKNDIGSDIAPYAPGYPLAASVAAIERIVQAIRSRVPKADIILMSTNPYTAGSSANPYQQAKGQAVRRVAAAYGCEWVDNFAAWQALGDYSALSTDGTHPNTAGHRKIADAILGHIPNTPQAPSWGGAPASGGVYHPELVDTLAGQYGYVSIAAPGTGGGLTYTCGGTGWTSELTTTPTDYVEAAHTYCTELAIQVSTATAHAPVVDVLVDGVVVAADLALHLQGKTGMYWVPFATGMVAGPHTVRLVLKSGTLETAAVAALASRLSAYTPAAQTLTLCTSAVIALDSGGATSYPAMDPIYLPSGWGSALVILTARIGARVAGGITERRYISAKLVSGAETIDYALLTFPTDAEEQRDVITMSGAHVITGTKSYGLEFRVLSATKTLCQITDYVVRATLLRQS